ncbi:MULTISPECIES: carboxymuconolactone decarboxylase family protein [Streptomycetaceae]|uniref:Carboxymuconolactone decarboxylase-like domain-containing protein n=1 Tax=Streptantibioticus cattleyicolor (strain ATCC 35852 / DSM 46488 / JCM 4925 / NBRC 14057 / NRRL 8057) TaxID=1003195 RepID=F8JQJ1_STREN|nr:MULTISPECIES: carboxymuconolactone decarboxylase family protein [Streptomycetaceae]AEW97837.1 hypothetical protein SCATT_54660 [Streptantibioticus cattleyicolor NRRL 8057 = DSM 46488]MYS62252.1 carboxymuconolactone decarboxylase family protein [Streptomyces sp. SID5468]CCB78155.1 conserved protein of unknown function [Streptantibioticus cattleyicolor NRRL 8057 = DSM 46488]
MTTTTTTTAERLDFARAAPKVFKTMIALDAAAREGVDPVLAELVKIRASQINHCAHCLDMHIVEARRAGENEQRIYLLDAWRETRGIYTDQERAALALAEAVTRLPDGVPDEVYAEAARHFDEAGLAQLIALILTINAWNRIAVTTGKSPAPQR